MNLQDRIIYTVTSIGLVAAIATGICAALNLINF